MTKSGGGIVRAPRRPAGWVAPGPAPAGVQGRPELEPESDEDLCFLTGDWRLFQKQRGHRWSLDDLVTAWIATRRIDADRAMRVLDLGTGLGSVLLMVAWKLPQAELVGIEAQADRAAMGRRSIAYNGVDARCRILDGDLREVVGEQLAGERFDLVTGTPPYFPRGTGTESEKLHALPCRFEVRGGVEDYFEAAARVLAPGGDIVVCSSALERDRVDDALRELALHRREHWDIVPRAGKQVLVMVDVVSNEATNPTTHTLTVRDRASAWTPEFQRVRTEMGLPATPPRG
ncbi:MAG: methyltransferase domain-containing protein [Deltaproteobacteria bacterium]|nr:methyltransferase domain-containing protein [Deltaproteobacteria bacterium]